ncbi:hypothetical protein CP532_1253 [Ophiocordyceps camponoti-leonardi (nom. inval.)]|nr:hypothetical protein CP532_1253 [Ophiocordyceps camponoti-leonardi (nom. inval.)]
MTDSETKKVYSIRTAKKEEEEDEEQAEGGEDRESAAFSAPSSSQATTTTAKKADGPRTPPRRKEMLSVDFSGPSVGPPRVERLKQMAVHHPAFAKLRHTQDILVKAQHALRRMPGVSGHDANELVASLQEVGRMVNSETTQLVDAIMNLTLDQEDSEQAMARMSIDANVAQAKTKDQLQNMVRLRADVRAERERREAAEVKARSALERVESLMEEVKRLREASVVGAGDDLVQVGESASRQGSPPLLSPPPIVERPVLVGCSPPLSSWTTPLQQEQQQQQQQQKTTVGAAQCRQVVRREQQGDNVDNGATPVRVASVFQTSTPLGPPKFGPLQPAVPPRAPASMTRGGSGGGVAGPSAGGPSWGRSVSSFAPSTGLVQAQSSSRAAGGGGFQPLPRYRSTDQHQHQHLHHNHNHHYHGDAFSHYQQQQLQHQHQQHQQHQYRPATAMGRRDYFPTTPPSTMMGGGPGPGPGVGGGGGPPAAAVAGGGARGGGQFGRFTDSSGSGAIIQLTDRAIGAWNKQISDFYTSIRHFVSRHAGEPDGGGGSAIMAGTGLWPVLLAMYHPLSEHEATSYLDFHLRTESSKSCVVTRVIVDYIVNRVWVTAAWTGSDTRTSYELLDVERELEATSSSAASARQSLLNQQASIISQIMKNEQGTNWHRNKMEDISRSLQATLQPLMNRFFNHGEARRDLDRVAEAAWELSSKMLSSRLTFDFRFPEIGSRFSTQSMLPIWPRLDPSELQAKHWRVAFVTTPVVTCRNDTGAGISAHSVSLADVFCMQ